MGQKFYAVRRGKQPGIYRTWPETQHQVNGFPGAQYKSFTTLQAAQTFMQGSTTPAPGRPTARQTAPVRTSAPAAITVYTDGGSRNTGNVAGGHVRAADRAAWAYRIELPDEVVTDSAGEWGASNNRMEIMAFLRALERLTALQQTHTAIVFVLDSQYVLNAVTKGWLAGWKRRGWQRSAGPLANAELWQAVDQQLAAFTQLQFQWTKGHATNQGNVFVDHLLNRTMDQMQPQSQQPVKPTGPAASATNQRTTPASQPAIDRSVAAIRQILKDAESHQQ